MFASIMMSAGKDPVPSLESIATGMKRKPLKNTDKNAKNDNENSDNNGKNDLDCEKNDTIERYEKNIPHEKNVPHEKKSAVQAWDSVKVQRFDPNQKSSAKYELTALEIKMRQKAAAAAVAQVAVDNEIAAAKAEKEKKMSEEGLEGEEGNGGVVGDFANLDVLKNIFYKEVSDFPSFFAFHFFFLSMWLFLFLTMT